MKIMVIGGTPIDTKMGCDLLEKNNFNDLLPISISQTPSEQTFFQISTQHEKNDVLTTCILKAKKNNCQLILVYCNSLSASINFEELSSEFGIKIITPFFVYREIAKTYQRIGLLSANAQGLSGIEREMIAINKQLEIAAVCNINWVNAVENRKNPSHLIKNDGLVETIHLFEKMGAEVIVFGCTHFPYFLKAYQKTTTIKCINPDDALLKEIHLLTMQNKSN